MKMKPKDYREADWLELMNYFGGYVKLERPIRFNLTPHTKTVKIYELDIKTPFHEYGEIRDTIIQRLKWLKHLKDTHGAESPK